MDAEKEPVKMGRPRKEHGRRVHKSIKVSDQVADYLEAVGTGIVENTLRRSKAFRDWLAGAK